jgi:hypothetical protein
LVSFFVRLLSVFSGFFWGGSVKERRIDRETKAEKTEKNSTRMGPSQLTNVHDSQRLSPVASSTLRHQTG